MHNKAVAILLFCTACLSVSKPRELKVVRGIVPAQPAVDSLQLSFAEKIFHQVAVGEIEPKKASEILNDLNIPKATKVGLAIKVFDSFIAPASCEAAAEVAWYFGLGPNYLDKAILCNKLSLYYQVKLACQRPGTASLQRQVINSYLAQLSEKNIGYFFMPGIVEVCPLTAQERRNLFTMSMNTGKVEFAQKILDAGGFERTSADYGSFIALALEQYECQRALSVALKHELPDEAIEKIFTSKRCVNESLTEFDPALVPAKRVEWFFTLCLQEKKFSVAGKVVKAFKLDRSHFDRIIATGIQAKDFDNILLLDPYHEEPAESFRFTVFDKMLDAGEEWAIVLFVKHGENANLFGYQEINRWIEISFARAFFRGQYVLAAEIAANHNVARTGRDGIKLAFEAALQDGREEEDGWGKDDFYKDAFYIAIHHKLGTDYLARVANFRRLKLLRVEQQKAAQMAREAATAAQKVKERCKNSRQKSEWGVDTCR